MREKWTNKEMILTLYIYLTHNQNELNKNSPFLIDFCNRMNKYTGNNKTPSSIGMRISNYKSVDPNYNKIGLANGGKNVLKIWNKYSNNLKFLEKIYTDFVSSTFDGITIDSVRELKEIEKDVKYKKIDLKNKDSYIETLINLRNGEIQRIFRKNLIIEFNQKCALCNINNKNLLISSHILPYSKCKKKADMINHNNGLLLCPIHDALFDKKLISFDNYGKILINSKIDKKLFNELNINENVKLNKSYLNKERIYFLNKHRQIFEKNNK